MHITTVILVALFALQTVFADPCSIFITDHDGTLAIPNNCETMLLYLQNPNVSYWVFNMTWLSGGTDDRITIYDGPDHYYPYLCWQISPGSLGPIKSSGRFITVELIHGPPESEGYSPWGNWSITYTNYEENPSLMTGLGYLTTHDQFECEQTITGVANDTLGSTWKLVPNWGNYMTEGGCSVSLYLADFEDTTGTLQIEVIAGWDTVVLDAKDLLDEIVVDIQFPEYEDYCKLWVRSSVRTKAGSHSNFHLIVTEEGYYPDSSSSSGHHHYGIKIIVLGVLVGIGFIIGVAWVVRCCYRRKKNRNQGYQPLNTSVTPSGLPLYNNQPVFMMMPVPHPSQSSVPSQTH